MVSQLALIKNISILLIKNKLRQERNFKSLSCPIYLFIFHLKNMTDKTIDKSNLIKIFNSNKLFKRILK
jgi:hypothetical protein